MIQTLYPLKKGNIVAKKLIGFDTETYGDDNKFLLGTAYSDDEQKVFLNKEEMQEYFMNQEDGTFIVASNLQFDFNVIFFGSKYFYECTPIINGSHLVSMIYEGSIIKDKHIDIEGREMLYKKKQIYFIDTYNYMQGSVEYYGKIIGVPKMERPSYIGEYPQDKEQWKYLTEYCMRDSEVTFKFIKFLQTSYNNIGCNMKLTSASTSMDLFKRKYLHRPIASEEGIGKNINKKLFQSYYGGRTEIFKRGYYKNMNYFDVNSLYPSCMMNEFPDPDTAKFVRYASFEILEYEGVSEVIMDVKEMHIPILPVMHEKLLFPTGHLRGTYTHLEIRKAIAEGYRLRKILWTIYYKRTFAPFREYITDMYHARKDYKAQGNPAELVFKLSMNCFSRDTKIYTTKGLKSIVEVKKGDIVYSINPKTLCTEYKKVTRTFKYKYTGDMYHLHSLKYDALVTPNHKFLCKHREGKEWKFVQAKDMYDEILPKCTTEIDGDYPKTISIKDYVAREDSIKDDRWYRTSTKKGRQLKGQMIEYDSGDLMEFIGWYLSEGTTDIRNGCYKVKICQKTIHKRKIIESLLKRMNIMYYQKYDSYEIYDKSLLYFIRENFGMYDRERKIPNWIYTLHHILLRRMYTSMMLGDGYHGILEGKNRRQTQKYTTNSEQLAHDFQRLCVHLGIHTKIIFEKANIKKQRGETYRVFILQHKYFSLTKKHGQVEIVKNNSNHVYCIEVEDNHTVLTYRRGMILFTSQSLYGKFAQKNMTEIRFIDYNNEQEKLKTFAEYPVNADTSYTQNFDSKGYVQCKKICQSAFVRPIFAIYTTAFARVKMWDYITKYDAGYCDSVSKDSILHTSLGDMTFEKFWEQHYTVPTIYDRDKEFKECHISVLTCDGKNNIYVLPKRIIRHKVTQELVKIYVTNSEYIMCTANHSLIGKDMQSIKSSDVKVGMNILVSTRIPHIHHIHGEGFTELDFELMGHIIANGYINKQYNNKTTGMNYIHLSSQHNKKIVYRLKSLQKIYKYNITYQKNKFDIIINSTYLATKYYNYGLQGDCYTKRVPKDIFYESKENICAFLRGYFNGDGSISIRSNNPIIKVDSVNKELLYDIRTLLRIVGLAHSYSEEPKNTHYKNVESKYNMKRINILDKYEFMKHIGFNNGTEKKITHINKERRDINIDYRERRVIKIEYISYDDYVYDLEIPSYQRFYSNNILVHNTDSIITRKEIPDSKELGYMKLETKIRKGIFVKPKMYMYEDTAGKEVVKLKGVPRADMNTFERILERKDVHYMKFTKMKESIKRGELPNRKVQMSKSIRLEDNKRVWSMKFQPYFYDEYSEPYDITM